MTCPQNFPHRRFIFCGTFRDRSVSRPAPWRYQARCSSAFRPCSLPLGVRTFLPRLACDIRQNTARIAPAIAQPTRQFHFTLLFYFVDIQTTLLASTAQTPLCFVSQVNSPCPHNKPQDIPEYTTAWSRARLNPTRETIMIPGALVCLAMNLRHAFAFFTSRATSARSTSVQSGASLHGDGRCSEE